MHAQAEPSLKRYAVGSHLAAMLVGCAIGAAAGFGVSALAGWGGPKVLGLAIVGALGPWVLAMGGCAAMLALITQRDIGRLAMPLLALGFMRMLLAIGIGAGVFFLFKVGEIAEGAGRGFWVMFLGAGLGCLAAENWWGIRLMSQLESSSASVAGVGSKGA